MRILAEFKTSHFSPKRYSTLHDFQTPVVLSPPLVPTTAKDHRSDSALYVSPIINHGTALSEQRKELE